MKKFALALLFLQPALVFAAEKQNPADFPVKVHVITSASITSGGSTSTYYFQVLEATIERPTH